MAFKTTRPVLPLPLALAFLGACAPRALPGSFEPASPASVEAREAPPARVNDNLETEEPEGPPDSNAMDSGSDSHGDHEQGAHDAGGHGHHGHGHHQGHGHEGHEDHQGNEEDRRPQRSQPAEEKHHGH